MSVGKDDGIVARIGCVDKGTGRSEVERFGRWRGVDDRKRVRRGRSRGRSVCLGLRVREPEGGKGRMDHRGNRFWEKVS